MTTISASDVNKLRLMTGAGMMDCKKALTETNGDFEAAIDFLRKKGQKISSNRADRKAGEGAVIAITSADRKKGVIVELNCETDFVAKNADFVKTANEIASAALAAEVTSLDQLLTMNVGSEPLEKRLLEEMTKIGEKIEVSKYEFFRGENVVNYIHAGNRIGVLVLLNNAPNEINFAAGKDAAMQIAAMNPVSVDKNDVPETVKQRELEIGMEQARVEGKPEAMLEKIALGKLEKYYKEATLLNQEFVKDPSKTVGKMLLDTEPGLNILQFKRVQLG